MMTSMVRALLKPYNLIIDRALPWKLLVKIFTDKELSHFNLVI
jgi:hypothetical protein